jgi:hypothetical protein
MKGDNGGLKMTKGDPLLVASLLKRIVTQAGRRSGNSKPLFGQLSAYMLECVFAVASTGTPPSFQTSYNKIRLES